MAVVEPIIWPRKPGRVGARLPRAILSLVALGALLLAVLPMAHA